MQSLWKPYSGNSKDVCYTFIEVQCNQSKENKALYRCRIYKAVNSIANGPSNVKRHLYAKHGVDCVETTYENWKSNGAPNT